MLKIIGISIIISVLASCGSKTSAKDIDPKEFDDVCDCANALEQLKEEMESELDAIDKEPTDEQRRSYEALEKKHEQVYRVCLKRFNMKDLNKCQED